jgi:hypothetical protein
MIKVIKDTMVFVNGMSQLIPTGKEYKKDHVIAGLLPEGSYISLEEQKDKRPKDKIEEIKPTKTEADTELLVEEPVAEAEVTVKDESAESEAETKPKRRRRKS